jgi:16S rRNA C967 or C1407 C5-methylase (RsmB/RsmF family)
MNLSSLPAGFAARMEDMLGDEWPAFLSEYEKRAETALRFRGGRTAVPPSLQEELLTDLGITDPQPVPWAKNAWYYEEAQPCRALWHDMGLYYIQEPSAMAAAPKVCPEAGERVLDLCAAPGGKSTELAAKLQGKGLLVANDISNSRAQALLKNLELFGVKNALILSEEPKKLAERFPEYFDKILIDAPCSGQGMFRKDPAVI